MSRSILPQRRMQFNTQFIYDDTNAGAEDDVEDEMVDIIFKKPPRL